MIGRVKIIFSKVYLGMGFLDGRCFRGFIRIFFKLFKVFYVEEGFDFFCMVLRFRIGLMGKVIGIFGINVRNDF